MNKTIFATLLSVLFCIGNYPFSAAHAQGTAFTYQGRLDSGGAAANGSYDMAFTLFATNVTGTALVGPVTNTAIGVTNGLFTTIVAFGPGIFTGGSNWLEIAVSTNAANAFSTLAPRHQLTPVPYAITAENVSGAVLASSISGELTNGNLPTSPTLSGTVTAAAFAGNGTGVTNVNAAALNGLNAANFWQLGGNYVAAGKFLGSTNYEPVELWANNGRALRLEPGGPSTYLGNGIPTAAPNVVGGSPVNYVASGVVGAVIAGGGATNYAGIAYTNSVWADLSFLGGGVGNSIQLGAIYSFLGGGQNNSIQPSSYASFLGGGVHNSIQGSANFAFLGGGDVNSIQPFNSYSVLVGGEGNSIQTNAYNSVLVGGNANFIQTSADHSFLGGGSGNFIQQYALYSFLGDGYYNYIQPRSSESVLVGGDNNIIQSNLFASYLGGGEYNTIQPNADHSFLGGGTNNSIQTSSGESVLGGGNGNSIQTFASESFLGCGYNNSIQFYDYNTVLGGGEGNSIWPNADHSFLGGGLYNSIQTDDFGSFLGGGENNSIQPDASDSVLAGGSDNSIETNAAYAVIGGGANNEVGNSYATVPGGYYNFALGEYSFAAGQQAQAIQQGTFVWADSQNTPFYSTAPNQFLIRAAGNVGINTAAPGAPLHVANGSSSVAPPNPGSVGAFESSGSAYINLLTPSANESGLLFGNGHGTADGGILYNSGSITRGLEFRTGGNVNQMVITSAGNVGIATTSPGYLLVVGSSGSPAYCNGTTWQNGSDRNIKKDFDPISPQEVLARVSALPITEWQYKVEAVGTKHIGPMAQDFHAAFGLNGADDKHISTVDEGGVALAAIQGLNQKLEEQKTENNELKAQLADLKILVNQLAQARLK